MSKQKRNIIMVIILSLILAITLTAFFVTKKDEPQKETDNKTVSSEVSSDLKVEDIENEEKNQENSSDIAESNFIEPDETKADKILEDRKNNKNNSSVSKPTDTASKTESQTSKPATVISESNTFEDGKKELENRALQYLIEHNIDIKTAGETGEMCQHCGKKIWNPDKYGSFIPGMPEDYENSGYCLGTCAISFD